MGPKGQTAARYASSHCSERDRMPSLCRPTSRARGYPATPDMSLPELHSFVRTSEAHLQTRPWYLSVFDASVY